MSTRNWALRAGFISAALFCSASLAAAGELPTAEQILKIYQANQERLSGLHLQWEQVFETTEAQSRQNQLQAQGIEAFRKLMAQGKLKPGDVKVEGSNLSEAEVQELLEEMDVAELDEQAKNLREQTKPTRSTDTAELFLRGNDYQFRLPEAGKLHADWRFPVDPVTAESLPTVYRDFRIFSRLSSQKPAARWWYHHDPVETTDGHLGDKFGVLLPPFTAATRMPVPNWHPIDMFFSRPVGEYRVLRQEQLGGRQVTVVEVTVPLNGALRDKPGATLYVLRAWIDLAQGAVPLRVEQGMAWTGQAHDRLDPWVVGDVTTTERIKELPGGGFYPAKTLIEQLGAEPGSPVLSMADWSEVAAGKRKSPLVAHSRRTWNCTLVEIRGDLDDAFFRLPIPNGYRTDDFEEIK